MGLVAKQMEAVRKLAASNPHRWKKQLRDFWEKGRTDGSEFQTLLYGLRNTHGPSWLARVRLTEVA